MTYLSLEEIKKQLNIDSSFIDDDQYLIDLGNVAEQMVSRHIDQDLSKLQIDSSTLPAPITHAMKLYISNLYMQRESISNVNMNKVPNSYEYLLATYKNRSNFAS